VAFLKRPLMRPEALLELSREQTSILAIMTDINSFFDYE